MIWDIKVHGRGRRGLKALKSVPGHVLDRDQGPVCEGAEVEEAVSDYRVVCSFDHGGEGAEGGWEGLIVVREEVGACGADPEVCAGGGVQGLLDVCAIKIVVWAATQGGEAEFIVQVGTGVCEMVDVEAGVDVVDCVVDVVVEIAAWEGGIWWCWDWPWWGEGVGVFVEVIGIAAGFCSCCDVGHVRLVYANDILVILKGGYNGNCYIRGARFQGLKTIP